MFALGAFEVCTQTVTCHNSDYDRIIIIIIIISSSSSSSSSSSLLCIIYKYTNICIFVGD